ncbi:MAG: FAD-dependent oxidoreductase [Sphingopyxis terrae]|nr:FAD-dependent oxidoreductase [Sphingopyxis terrae]
MTEHYDVAIVGAGHAGAHAAITLRSRGFTGSILLIGEETMLPYDRPSLSKAYMLGSIGIEQILLRDASYWAEHRIDIALGVTTDRLDTDASTLQLSDGRTIGFGHCILATGGSVRTLSCPGADLPGIHSVRSIADADAIRAALRPGMKVVIVGAGYVGLEAAAVLRELDHPVTVVEAQDRVLARVTGPGLAGFVERKHRSHGVEFRFGQQVVAIEGDGRVEAVVLQTGERLAADLVIAGIGIAARSELAEAAGLACDGGVIVDQCGRASGTSVFAIGDCARHPNSFAGGLWRLESVQHATGSAEVAADAIMNSPRCYDALPTFWSDQYDMRIQSAGILRGTCEAVVRGDMASGSFSIFYLQSGAVIALDAVNCPKDFMGGRALVQDRARVDSAQLADTSIPTRQIAKQLIN